MDDLHNNELESTLTNDVEPVAPPPHTAELMYVARDCLRTRFMIPHQNKGQLFEWFAESRTMVKYGKQYLSCHGLRAYCVGKHRVLGTSL